MAGSIGGRLYVMGGQMNEGDDSTAKNDVYESADGGRNWHWMSKTPVPWSGRGMVHGMPVIDGELYLVGGARYMRTELFDGVYAFKPDRRPAWRVVRRDWQDRSPLDPDNDPDGWPSAVAGLTSGRGYHNVVWTPGGPDDRHGIIWVITGSVGRRPKWGSGSCKGILTSRDTGATWRVEMDADWGIHGSHADAVTVWKGRIVRASGAANDRSVYWISRELLVANYPERPVVNGFLVKGETVQQHKGDVGDVVTLTGDFSEGVSAVYVSAGIAEVVYTTFGTPVGTAPDQSLNVTMPAYPPYTGKDEVDVYIVVVGPGGSSDYGKANFFYKKI
jgi:hypothetical protein